MKIYSETKTPNTKCSININYNALLYSYFTYQVSQTPFVGECRRISCLQRFPYRVVDQFLDLQISSLVVYSFYDPLQDQGSFFDSSFPAIHHLSSVSPLTCWIPRNVLVGYISLNFWRLYPVLETVF